MIKRTKTFLVAWVLVTTLSTPVFASNSLHEYSTKLESVKSVGLFANTSSDFVITGGVLKKYNGTGGDVVIPDGVTTIGDQAFQYSNITSVTIPKSVTSISKYYAFDGCNSLTKINVDPENTQYSSEDGVLFDKYKTNLILYPTGNKNESYTIPNGVVSIGMGAFSDCKALKSVTIPDSVTDIGSAAFLRCTSLTSINIPGSVRTIWDAAFSACSSLSKIDISEGVTTIYYDAFKYCSNLSDVSIPKSVTSIGSAAFDNTKWIKDYPNDFVTIGDNILIKYKGSQTDVVIPDNVKSIAGHAFYECDKITSVTIPETVTAIADDGFLHNLKVSDGYWRETVFDMTVNGKTNSYAESYVKHLNSQGFNNVKFNSIGTVTYIPNAINVSSSERLSGDTRYKTAVAISQKGWTQSDNVVLASGENHTDALVGSSFAYLKNAPVLITPSDNLDEGVSSEIDRLQAKTVYIIGNTSAVSQNIENNLKTKYNVVRIGGDTPEDTAIKVAEEVRKLKYFETVAIVNKADFPDAIAMAPFSAMNTMPILFTDTDSVSDNTIQMLKKCNIDRVFIAGGTGVVSDEVSSKSLWEFGIITRLAGKDRYDTALEIIKQFEPAGGYKNISIASGENYPDALTGAVLSAKLNIPMVLTESGSVKDAMLQYLNERLINKAYIFGGEGVVSKNITTN